uniref:Uncharacterized protein n=1 Tax=Arundo donax TaxID=35708 RepID=A0A0A9HET5_ARUDO
MGSPSRPHTNPIFTLLNENYRDERQGSTSTSREPETKLLHQPCLHPSYSTELNSKGDVQLPTLMLHTAT